jgi:hypothetical protein
MEGNKVYLKILSRNCLEEGEEEMERERERKDANFQVRKTAAVSDFVTY